MAQVTVRSVRYPGQLLHRLHARKTEVRIFDYVDREEPVLRRMFEKRLRTYRAIGYAEPVEEPTVEAAQESLRLLDEEA